MKFFVDTADVSEISDLNETGLLDGVTTNPSLIMKAGRDIMEVTKEICSIVDGPVSAEVTATDFDGMLKEAAVLARIADNICIKLPLTLDGLKACKRLTGDGHKTNVTLCFSANQALLAAKAGATFISPFVGRLDDISGGRNGADFGNPDDLRQLRFQDRDPCGIDPHSDPRQAGGPDRRRCRHGSARDPARTGQPPADRQGTGRVPGGLGKDRTEDRLKPDQVLVTPGPP